MDIGKRLTGLIIISIMAIIQLFAWKGGFDGQVFAFTSFIIGIVTGVILDVKIDIARITQKKP